LPKNLNRQRLKNERKLNIGHLKNSERLAGDMIRVQKELNGGGLFIRKRPTRFISGIGRKLI